MGASDLKRRGNGEEGEGKLEETAKCNMCGFLKIENRKERKEKREKNR